MNAASSDANELLLAPLVAELRRGGVVAFPTESSYGLAADATSAEALDRLFELKQRPAEKAPPLIISDVGALSQVTAAPLSDEARALMTRYWPGPLTLVLPALPTLTAQVCTEGRVAVRVPGHPLARRLAQLFGGPLTATSANLSGAPPALSADDVRAQLGSGVSLLDGGVLPGGPPSTIVELSADGIRVLRQGAIAL